MHKRFLQSIITLGMIAFSSPVLASYQDDPDAQNMQQRQSTINLAIETHHLLNAITGTPHANFSQAINAISDQQIDEYFGLNNVSRQDFRDLNYLCNKAKHDWN